MRHLSRSNRPAAITGAIAALALLLGSVPSQAQSRGGFAEYAGAWSGSGRVVSTDGSEAIRCRAQGQVGPGGESVEQHLVCASSSYQFNIDCRARESGGQISGSWTETTRGISGSLSGTLRGGRLQAAVDSPIFSATVVIVTRGTTQEVTISPHDNDIRQVSVRLRRS